MNGGLNVSTGIVRRIDELGRIVIPKEIRKNLRIKNGDNLEIIVDGENITVGIGSIGDIPESITSISNSAFSGCNDLKSVTIPNSVKVIGNAAFQGCRNLASVTIPPSVTYIGGGAFGSTAWYTNQEDGLIYINNMVYRYKGTNPEKTDITIKEGIISICENAFYGCSDLTSIAIPTSVTSIEAGAFYGCI